MIARLAFPFLAPSLIYLSLLGPGCAGSSGHLEDDLYSKRETRYRIAPPDASWRPLKMSEVDNDLAWEQPALDAAIQVNSSCAAGLDVPLQALTNHLLIGFTDRQTQSRQSIDLDGREALVTHLIAKLDGVPRELVLTVLKKDLCVYDFALVAPPGERFQQALPTYDRLVARFRTERQP